MTIDHTDKIASELGLKPVQVRAAVELFDQGNTLPFVARYRKEATSGLDEDQLREISSRIAAMRALEERRQTVLASIEEQGKLTTELRSKLLAAATRTELEDLYQPYKPKRRTRAGIAREKGLSGLADEILNQTRSSRTIEQVATTYLNDQVPTVEEALAGARDIVAETISDRPRVRQQSRDKALKWALLTTEKVHDAEDERRVFETYYEFECRVDRVQHYQVLAINRGETEKVLRARVEIAERDWRAAVTAEFRADRRSVWAEQLELSIDDAAKRLLLPAIERDVRHYLTEQAEEHAIKVFARNLSGLLGSTSTRWTCDRRDRSRIPDRVQGRGNRYDRKGTRDGDYLSTSASESPSRIAPDPGRPGGASLCYVDCDRERHCLARDGAARCRVDPYTCSNRAAAELSDGQRSRRERLQCKSSGTG